MAKNVSRELATMTDEKRREADIMNVNVGRTERWISGIAGAAVLGYGLGNRRLRAVLLPIGVGLIGRAISGRSAVNRFIRRNSAHDEGRLGSGEGTKLEESVIIHSRPRGELFHFWRQLDNLPRFMDNLESVTVLGPQRSHWVAKGPLGTRVEWDAEILNEIEDELIAWRSLPGSDVDQAGSVHFSPVFGGGTEVRVVMRYATPAGKVGDAVAHILGDDPSRQIAEDLRRFKQVVDAGDVASLAPMAERL